MVIRLALAASVAYFTPPVFGAGIPTTQSVDQSTTMEEPEAELEDFNAPESILRRQSLAVHLGLAPTDVVFGQPRNFRSETLNNVQLEPLYDIEEN